MLARARPMRCRFNEEEGGDAEVDDKTDEKEDGERGNDCT